MNNSGKTLLVWSCFVWMTVFAASGVQAQAVYPPSPLTYSSPYTQPYGYQPYIQPYTQPYTQPYVQPTQPCFSYGCGYPSVPQSSCTQGMWGQSSSEQFYRCALSLVYARRYTEAIHLFQMFLNYYPQSSLADNALYWTGECYYAQKQYATAIGYFQQVICDYPKGNKVPDALLKIALSYFSLKNYPQGCGVLSELLSRYPRSESAYKAYSWTNRCGYAAPSYSSPYSLPYDGTYYTDPLLPKNW